MVAANTKFRRFRRAFRRDRASMIGNAAVSSAEVTAVVVASSAGMPPSLQALGYFAATWPTISDIASRTLSHNERSRVERVLELAADIAREHQDAGAELRRDGWFDRHQVTGRSSADEAVEAVLLVAKGTYEERKLPFLAELFARIAHDETFTPAVANRIIRLAEDLSWTQYVLLALIDNKATIALPDVEVDSGTTWESWSIRNQIVDLESKNLAYGGTKQTEWGQLSIPDRNFGSFKLAHGGILLVAGLGLREIGDLDRATVVTDLLRVKQ